MPLVVQCAELAELERLGREVDLGDALERVSMRDEVDDAAGREPDPAYAGVDDEALVDGFVVCAAEVNAAMCRWLQMLAEIVARRIWVDHGARTPAEWLSYTVSMAPSTARERVRVALRLRHFPEVTEAFAAGRLSYSKVRAITRTGRPDLEELLLSYAEHATGAQLETVLRGFCGARRRETADVLSAFDRRDLQRVERGDGTTELRIVLPDEEAATVWAQYSHAAETAQAEAKERRDPDDPEAPPLPRLGQLRADAAVEAASLLAGARPDDTSGIDRHTLVLHAPASVLAAPADEDEPILVRASAESRLRPMSVRRLRRLACDVRLALVAHDDHGNVVSASGTTRRIPARLRRMLHARDRGCRFPSCTATRGLDGHHIVHWGDGGPTELHNLVLLCRYHHTFLHQRRWEILTDGHGHFRFQPPDDDARPTVLDPPEVDPLTLFVRRDDLDFAPMTYPGPLAPTWDGTRPDIDAAVSTLLEELERLRPPDHPILAA